MKYDLIVFDDYEYKGKKRTRPYYVGKAVRTRKAGFLLFIPEGIAVSGRVLMAPEKTEMSELDLLEAYESAAAEHGL